MGVLASALLIPEGFGEKKSAEFGELLLGLGCDHMPIGTLEEMLTETIAACEHKISPTPGSTATPLCRVVLRNEANNCFVENKVTAVGVRATPLTVTALGL